MSPCEQSHAFEWIASGLGTSAKTGVAGELGVGDAAAKAGGAGLNDTGREDARGATDRPACERFMGPLSRAEISLAAVADASLTRLSVAWCGSRPAPAPRASLHEGFPTTPRLRDWYKEGM